MAATIILMIIAIILIIIAIQVLRKFKDISKEGTEVEGIIFELEQSSSTGTGVSYPVVRFLTQDNNQWITEKSNIGTIPGLYKKGEKVSIVYSKSNPKKFYIKNNKSYFVPYLIVLIALVLLVAGGLKLIKVI